ncbi:pilus assembly protein TadG-related protein [Mesorhizobium sp. M1182]|uniref:TadE/TadG family type IV pilus assembly protein n=1 Tax=Mesorhizobium sp. M1182 TaxID=2957067 RepID=UPI00333A2F62
MEWGGRILRRFVSRQRQTGESGNIATIFALSLPIVVGAAGLGIETSYWYFSSLKLQAVADAAAYAGALEKVSGSDKPTIVSAATLSATTTAGTRQQAQSKSSRPRPLARMSPKRPSRSSSIRTSIGFLHRYSRKTRSAHGQERWLLSRLLQRPALRRSILPLRKRRCFPAVPTSN